MQSPKELGPNRPGNETRTRIIGIDISTQETGFMLSRRTPKAVSISLNLTLIYLPVRCGEILSLLVLLMMVALTVNLM